MSLSVFPAWNWNIETFYSSTRKNSLSIKITRLNTSVGRPLQIDVIPVKAKAAKAAKTAIFQDANGAKILDICIGSEGSKAQKL